MIPILVWPILGLGALLLWSRLEVTSLKNDALKKEVAAQQAIAEANATANRSAMRYEEARLALRTKTVYITRKVKNAIAADPVWSSASLPSGVRTAISEAAADLATAKPDGTVRAPDATGPEDQRGDGGGIRPKPGFFSRLLGSTPEPSGSGEGQ